MCGECTGRHEQGMLGGIPAPLGLPRSEQPAIMALQEGGDVAECLCFRQAETREDNSGHARGRDTSPSAETADLLAEPLESFQLIHYINHDTLPDTSLWLTNFAALIQVDDQWCSIISMLVTLSSQIIMHVIQYKTKIRHNTRATAAFQDKSYPSHIDHESCRQEDKRKGGHRNVSTCTKRQAQTRPRSRRNIPETAQIQ